MTIDFTINDDQRAARAGFRELLTGLMTEDRTRAVLDGPTFSIDVWRAVCAGGWLEVATGEPDPSLGAASLLVQLCECVGELLVPGPFALAAAVVMPALERYPAAAVPGLAADVASGAVTATILPPTGGTPDRPQWQGLRVEEVTADRVRLAGAAGGVVLGHLAEWILAPVVRADDSVGIALLEGDRLERRQDGALGFQQPLGACEAADVWVDRDAFLGGWDADLRLPLARWLQTYMLCIDAESAGGATAVLERTVAFVTQRRQFGVPVGSFQAVKHLLADAYADIELSRGLTQHVAARFDLDPDGCFDDLLASRILSADMYPRAVERCIQCHGGAGFTWEQGLHGWYRQALFHRHHPFSPEALRELLYARIAADTVARLATARS